MLLKLTKIVDETTNVKSFYWEPDENVEWIPGQYFYYTLPKLDYDDPRGATRHFTISSSPSEGGILRLTTKFSDLISGFKKTLLELKIGETIEGRGPQGTFTPKNGIFIAGGIGITPFRSIIKYNFDNNLELPYLIYSNSDENFVFEAELKQILEDKIIFYNSSISGHIDKSKIELALNKWSIKNRLARFYTVGPPPFVNALENELEKLGIDSDKIESEKFTGY